MRRACRIVNKTAGRVIADAVIKKTRNHIDFFGPGFVKIDSFPAGARIQLNYLRHGSARGTPKSAHPDSSAELLLHRRIFNLGPFYFWHKTSFRVQALACVASRSRQPKRYHPRGLPAREPRGLDSKTTPS